MNSIRTAKIINIFIVLLMYMCSVATLLIGILYLFSGPTGVIENIIYQTLYIDESNVTTGVLYIVVSLVFFIFTLVFFIFTYYTNDWIWWK